MDRKAYLTSHCPDQESSRGQDTNPFCKGDVLSFPHKQGPSQNNMVRPFSTEMFSPQIKETFFSVFGSITEFPLPTDTHSLYRVNFTVFTD